MTEHREIEESLDRFAEPLVSGALDLDAFRRVHALCISHYRNEEPFLHRLAASHPALAAKLKAQHDEALEIASRLEESTAAGQAADALYLARRFAAIVQHNIIEEERDVFPLYSEPRA